MSPLRFLLSPWHTLALAFAAVLLLNPQPLRAESYSVAKTPCRGFEWTDGKWVSQPEVPLTSGATLKGRPVAGRTDLVTVKVAERIFSVPLSCLTPDPAAGSVTNPPAASPAKTTAQSTAKRPRSTQSSANAAQAPQPASHFYLMVNGLNWSETVTLASSAGDSYPLYISNVGGGAGLGYLLALGRSFDLSFELGGFFLMSDATATPPSGAASSVEYELSSPAAVFGGRFQPGIAWHTASRFFSIGLAIPLIYRIGNWPIPPNGTDASGNTVTYTISGLSAFSPGALLETRFRFGRFLVMPRGGIYGTAGDVMFDLGLGFAL